jgi:phosphoglycolate phosphatase
MTNRFPGVKAAIFDLDGTLVDAFGDIISVLNRALEHWNYPQLPFDTVKSFIGDGPRMLLSRALAAAAKGELPPERFEEIYPWYRSFYEANHGAQVTAYPGAIETLAALRERGFKVAVLTNKPHSVVGRVLAGVGLAPHIQQFWGQVDGSPQKPDAEALLQVARFFNLQPAELVMIGDGPADMEVAKNAGAYTIGVTYGQLSREQIEKMAPDAIVERLPEVLGLLGE